MPLDAARLDRLRSFLLEQAALCVRPPAGRFEHPWLAGASGDLVQLDASEAAIELCHHEKLRPAAAGSLVCLLDGADASGVVPRTQSPHAGSGKDPCKPLLAQLAARVLRSLGPAGPELLKRHRVPERIAAFIGHLEKTAVGAHGLFLTHSAVQSGFQSDALSAHLPDLSVEGPDTNALMVREYKALAQLWRAVGKRGEADECDANAAKVTALMERLLYTSDDRGGFYGALQWSPSGEALQSEWVRSTAADGQPRPAQSWTTLLPLYAGIPSPERARAVVARLLDPSLYWGPRGPRTAPKDDPLFHQAALQLAFDQRNKVRAAVANWSGPVRVLASYYLCKGLARYGFIEKARELALKTAELLADDLERTGRLHEAYDDAGKGLWPPTSGFALTNVLALSLVRQLAPELAGHRADAPTLQG